MMASAGRSDITRFTTAITHTVDTPLVMQGGASFAITIDKEAPLAASGDLRVAPGAPDMTPQPRTPGP